jgi:DNA-binding SARP family transcriptional activator/Flp pilus assembly protein TadD
MLDGSRSDAPLRWTLLGPVGLRVGEQAVDLGRGKQLTVLAALLMTPGQVVPVTTLVERVWGERPPRSATPLAPYVTRLRNHLEAAVAAEDRPVLRHQAGGYRLDCAADGVDLHQARRLAASARSARDSGDDRRAVSLFRRALADWSPVALGDVPGDWAAGVREALGQERLDVWAECAEAELRLGEHGRVVTALRPLVGEHPTAEALVASLMIALAAQGRAGEALDCFAATRRALAERLGAEPSPRLQQVQLRILRREAVADRAPIVPAVAGDGSVPSQLPNDVADFTGRAAELSALDDLLSTGAASAGGAAATPVVIVCGMAGAGKTALAVHWAHRVARRFPDGRLFVNLRGHDPDRPLRPEDALADLLTALNVPEDQQPVGLDARAARYRSELSGRRVLVVLDNAESAEQLRPLLPGSGPCLVVATSRDRLPGVVARDGAHRIEVSPLPVAEAVALLRRSVGRRVDEEASAAERLAERCAYLPLALRLAGEVAASRPEQALGAMAQDLGVGSRALQVLDADGDSRAAVRDVLSWSLRHLSPEAVTAFTVLGLHPGPDWDAHAAAALTGTDLRAAQRSVDELLRAQLVQPADRGRSPRYAMHDLLRALARELCDTAAADAALDRLLACYAWTVEAAVTALHPAENEDGPAGPAPTPVPELADPDAARRWLDVERATLTTTSRFAADHGRPAFCTSLSRHLYRYLLAGHYTDALAVHSVAEAAARDAGDTLGEAHAALGLGATHARLTRMDRALGAFRQAAALFERAGDAGGELRALGNVAMCAMWACRFAEAENLFRRALVLARRLSDTPREIRALNGVGDIVVRFGKHEEALGRHQEALSLARRLGDPTLEAETLNYLAEAERRLGRSERAIRRNRHAMALFAGLGDRAAQAWCHYSLGMTYTGAGQPRTGADEHTQALAIIQELDEDGQQAWALNGLGEAAAAQGHVADASAHHGTALAIAHRNGMRDQQARAHAGLAAAYQLLGEPELARGHLQRAHDLYAELGVPEADAVLEQLTLLGGASLADRRS